MRSLIVNGRNEVGLFSHFFSSIGACDYLEKNPEYDNVYFDLRVDIYDNMNIWEFLFEQGKLPDPKAENFRSGFTDFNYKIGCFLSEEDRNSIYRLIQKYVVIKKDIRAEYDELARTYADRPYVAVHRRATDHYMHGEIVDVQHFFRALDDARQRLGIPHVYLATDDLVTLEQFKEHYGSDLIYIPHFVRVTGDKGIHAHPQITDKKRVLKEALFEGLLLAGASYLVKTYSNLSMFAICMNRDLPYVDVDKHVYYDVVPSRFRLPHLGWGIRRNFRKFRQKLVDYIIGVK